MLPKINSLRSKEIKLNGKSIIIKPWTNIQLTNFESLYDTFTGYKFDLICKELIYTNIECKFTLTLIEEKCILNELYKLSKSNNLDVVFTCEECESKSSYVINLEKCVTYKPLQKRTFKTKDCIFNLKAFSNYRMNLNEDITKETLRYLASFIESFDYKDKNYEVTDEEEFIQWLTEELDEINFTKLLEEFTLNQNTIEINVLAGCEFCGHQQKLNFKGVDYFLT